MSENSDSLLECDPLLPLDRRKVGDVATAQVTEGG